ncbi:MAG: hypothetical protein RQ748_04715, partial [Elusimicrobiales bacterium]|nr:hypothetical protein [Elusimicrobiales bacterium]
MKKTALIAVFALAMPVSAQNGAMSQLEASAPAAAAVPVPASPSAREGAETAGAAAKEMWKALNFVSIFEEADFHVIEGGKDVLKAESVSCVDENYTACSMFVTVEGERKLIVTLDASVKMIRAFYSNGFAFDDETGILYASRVS